jgi:hypothetical protein
VARVVDVGSELVVRGAVGAELIGALTSWVAAVQAWPAGSHQWGQYAEETPHGPVICRTENVSACHRAFAALVDGDLAAIAGEKLGAPATAFKDKINYKQPGGAGFRPHQDQVAYPGAHQVMSLLLAIDPCTIDSGCLWIAPDVDRELPVDDRGVVRADIADALDWQAAELQPGDVLCIPGHAPHYSSANATDSQRRVFIASYSPTSHGYTRTDYYGARQAVMTDATARDGRFRISTLADFEGTEVAAPAPAASTHP